jgi:hypothetical protein
MHADILGVSCSFLSPSHNLNKAIYKQQTKLMCPLDVHSNQGRATHKLLVVHEQTDLSSLTPS